MLDAAIEALALGAVVGVPTDTVYGLAVDPHNAEAVDSLFTLKGRSSGASLVVLADSIGTVNRLVDIPPGAQATVMPHWPGPLTAVLEARELLPPGVGTNGTLAVRVPDHEVLLELLSRWGPLAVTSANLSGQPPASSANAARSIFGSGVAVYVDGAPGGGVASSVIDFTVDPPVVLREGPVALS